MYLVDRLHAAGDAILQLQVVGVMLQAGFVGLRGLLILPS